MACQSNTTQKLKFTAGYQHMRGQDWEEMMPALVALKKKEKNLTWGTLLSIVMGWGYITSHSTLAKKVLGAMKLQSSDKKAQTSACIVTKQLKVDDETHSMFEDDSNDPTGASDPANTTNDHHISPNGIILHDDVLDDVQCFETYEDGCITLGKGLTVPRRSDSFEPTSDWETKTIETRTSCSHTLASMCRGEKRTRHELLKMRSNDFESGNLQPMLCWGDGAGTWHDEFSGSQSIRSDDACLFCGQMCSFIDCPWFSAGLE